MKRLLSGDQLQLIRIVGLLLGLLPRLGLLDAYPHYEVPCHACGFFAALPASLILNAMMGGSYYQGVCPYLVVIAVALHCRKTASCKRPQSATLSRRSFLVGAGVLGPVCWGWTYGNQLELHSLEVIHLEIPMPGLPPELHGLKVVVMADWHCGPLNSTEFLRQAMLTANAQNPDLILLPGDFIERSADYLVDMGELMALLRARIPGGVMATLGNHDSNVSQACKAYIRKAEVRLMEDVALRLTPTREWSEDWRGPGLCLAGVGDLWTSKISMEKTLGRVPRECPRLVMAHNPDTAELHPAVIDLMVSGHTHGGQVRFPIIGAPIVPSAYGNKYVHGLVQVPDYPVYVTRGLGVMDIPIRFGAPPEITVLTLIAAPARAKDC